MNCASLSCFYLQLDEWCLTLSQPGLSQFTRYQVSVTNLIEVLFCSLRADWNHTTFKASQYSRSNQQAFYLATKVQATAQYLMPWQNFDKITSKGLTCRSHGTHHFMLEEDWIKMKMNKPDIFSLSFFLSFSFPSLQTSTTANTPTYRCQNNRHVDCGPLKKKKKLRWKLWEKKERERELELENFILQGL